MMKPLPNEAAKHEVVARQIKAMMSIIIGMAFRWLRRVMSRLRIENRSRSGMVVSFRSRVGLGHGPDAFEGEF